MSLFGFGSPKDLLDLKLSDITVLKQLMETDEVKTLHNILFKTNIK